MRLFVAVDPPIAAVEGLDAAIGERAELLRWVPPHQWHLTLVFCGEVTEPVLPELRERLARAAAHTPAFRAQLSGVGTFPKQASRARVLWVGLGGETQVLTRLAERCIAAARRCGIEVEDRPFRPHLTLARARRDNALAGAHAGIDARPYLQRLSSYDGPPWTVESVRLVHSMLGAQVKHETVAEFPLAEGA